MIVVDTSVWIDATRTRGAQTRETLAALIDADEAAVALPVRLELTAGLSKQDRAPFLRGLTSLPLLVPTEETWTLIERWVSDAADRGHRFAVTDLLIAGLAAEIGGLVWSLDDDFSRLEGLGLIQTYQP